MIFPERVFVRVAGQMVAVVGDAGGCGVEKAEGTLSCAVF